MNHQNSYSYFQYNSLFYPNNSASLYRFLDPRITYYQQIPSFNHSQFEIAKCNNQEPLAKLEPSVGQQIDKSSLIKNSAEIIAKPSLKTSDKDKNYSLRNQKSTRNMRSNNLKYFVKYVRGFRQSPVTIEHIMAQNLHVSYSVKIFFQEFQKAFELFPNYISMKQMRNILQGSNEMLAKTLRILYRRFLKFDKTSYFICRTKLKKNVKKSSMKDCRQLLKQSFKQK